MSSEVWCPFLTHLTPMEMQKALLQNQLCAISACARVQLPSGTPALAIRIYGTCDGVKYVTTR